MNEDQLNSALQAEYLHLQKVIEDFDGRVLTIKAWSITFSLVALAGAFSYHVSALFFVSSISALLFWFLEGSWKTFQYAHYARSGEMEAHFRGEIRVDAPFQIGTSWYKKWQRIYPGKLREILFWSHVALPHLAIAFVGLLLFSLSVLGVIAL